MTPVTVGSNLLLCITGIVYTCKVVLSEGVLGNGYYLLSFISVLNNVKIW